MSIVANERLAIQKSMEYIERERTRLWDDYMKLVARMGELDEIEKLERTPTEEERKSAVLSLKDAIAVHNEVFHSEEKEAVPLLTYSGESTNLHPNRNQLLKDNDYAKRPVKVPLRRSKYRDIKSITEDVKSILKDAGRPLQVKDIIDKLKERDINTSSPYSLLYQVQQYDKRIQKAKRGYYQYKG